MFNRTTLRKFIAPRRQAREVIHLLILRTLAPLRRRSGHALRESPVFPIALFRMDS